MTIFENYPNPDKKFVRTHKLKIDQCYFENVLSGRKLFEIRKDDRDFQVGDWLKLECGSEGIQVEIIYKSTFMQQDGYCVLGFMHPNYKRIDQ